MLGPSGYWYLDGMDIWNTFAIGIKEGLAGFIPLTKRKESITNNWPDQNGIDVDVSRHFFSERTVTLTCWIFTESENEFWQKREAFIQQLAKPGLRRLTVTAHQSRSYSVIFQEVGGYSQVKTKTLKNLPDNMIVHEFSITLLEPQPQVDYSDVFIAGDNGEFLIV